MSREKSLDELRMEKLMQDVADIRRNQEATGRLIAEIHAEVIFGRNSGSVAAGANIKKACDELLKGNVVPMQVLNKKKTAGMN